MNSNITSLIVRVLTHQGYCSEADEDVQSHLIKIREKYRELITEGCNFATAIQKARIWWLTNFLNDNQSDLLRGMKDAWLIFDTLEGDAIDDWQNKWAETCFGEKDFVK